MSGCIKSYLGGTCPFLKRNKQLFTRKKINKTITIITKQKPDMLSGTSREGGTQKLC